MKKNIRRFKIDSLMHTQHMSEPVTECASQSAYESENDSDFFVLSDEATIIGICKSNCSIVLKQNITDPGQPTITYAAKKSNVTIIAVHEANNALFAGSTKYFEGQLVQFDLTSGQITKQYGDIGISSLKSCTVFNNLCFFGGYNSYKFTVVDLATRQIVHRPVTSATEMINSMTVCKFFNQEAEQKVLLFISGEDSDYSSNRSDVFDITDLVSATSI